MLSVSFYITSTPSSPSLSWHPPHPSLPSHSSFYCVRIQLELNPDCPSFGDIGALPLVGGWTHLTITCVCYLEQIFPAWRTEHKKRSKGFSSQAEWKSTTASLQNTAAPEQACASFCPKTFCYGSNRRSCLLMGEGWVAFLVWLKGRGYDISFCSLSLPLPWCIWF